MSLDNNPHGESTQERTGPTRRDVLRTTAAASAGGLSVAGFSGSGLAKPTVEDVDGVAGMAVDLALARAGGEVLDLLAGEGLLGEASPFELPTEQTRSIGEVAVNLEGRASIRGSDGVLRHVTVTHLDEGVLTVTVEPERDHAYAFLEPADGGEKLVFNPAMGFYGEPRDVGTANDCSTSCDCSNIACNTGDRLKECTTCCCHAPCGCCCDSEYSCC